MKNDNLIGEIDLVYTWVNGNDPEWIEKRNSVIGNVKAGSSVNCKGRYADNDELRYSLRSVNMYAPWIRKIFIVTDNQVPSWLDISNPKIQIVNHKDILPKECIPCFNSSVLEHFLCRIPDLKEHFIYSNDDMYINSPVSPSTFFDEDGLPIIRQNRRFPRKLYLWFREKVLGKKISNYNRKVHNAAKLVEDRYGKYYNGKAHHNMDSYCKSDCLHVEDVFKDVIAPSFKHHMRNDSDIQRSIYHYAALAEHRAHLRYVTQRESLRIHIENDKHYPKLEKYNPIFFCTNDSEYANDSDRLKAKEFLSRRFPDKSQFEKD